jgi:hypothetical protein
MAVGEYSYLEKDIFLDKQIKLSELLYDFNNNVPKPTNISYAGTFSDDHGEYSTAILRDFIENGSDTERKLYVVFGGLFAKSGQKTYEEAERDIAAMRAEKDPEVLLKLVDEHIYGVNDHERMAMHSAIQKILNTAKGLQVNYEKAASSQNPLYAAISKSKLSHDDSEFQDAALNIGWYQGMIIPSKDGTTEYTKKMFMEDIRNLKENSIASERIDYLLTQKLDNISVEGKNDFNIYSNLKLGAISQAEKEAFFKKYIDDVYQARVSKYELATTYHNEAAHTARKISDMAFNNRSLKDVQPIGNCIPLFEPDQKGGFQDDIETYAKNMRSMIVHAAKFHKNRDPQIKAMFGHDNSFENDLADEITNKLVLNPSKNFISGIQALNNRRITEGDHGRDPSATDEEVLLRVVEDEMYNSIMRKMDSYTKPFASQGDGDILSLIKEMGVDVKNGSVVDVESNLIQDNYNPAKFNGDARKDLRIARDLYRIQKTLIDTQNGRMTIAEAKESLSKLESKILNDGDKETILNGVETAVNTFFENKNDNFKTNDFGIKQDDVDFVMDANSSILERQAQEIYQKLYGDRASTKWLTSVGLAYTKGQEFSACLGSSRSATIKGHSPASEMQGCIDKLIDKFERDAKELMNSLSGAGHEMIAASGIAGLMVLLSIRDKAAAQRLKGMVLANDIERRGMIDYAASAKTPQEKVTRDMAIRVAMEGVADEVVDASYVETYNKELLWSEHEFQRSENPYLKNNKLLKDVFSKKGKSKDKDNNEYDNKAIAGFHVAEGVLKSVQIDDFVSEYKNMIQEDSKVLLKKEIQYEEEYRSVLEEYSRDKKHPSLYAERLTEILSAKHTLMLEGILSGAKQEVGDGTSLEMTTILSKEVNKTEAIANLFKKSLDDIKQKMVNIRTETASGGGITAEKQLELLELQDELYKLEKVVTKTQDAIEKMKEGVGIIKGIEDIAQSRKPFGIASNIFDDELSFAKRYGGDITSPVLMNYDLERLDRMAERIAKNNPGKYNNKHVGQAIQAIKTTIETVAVEQYAAKNRKNSKASYMDLYEKFQTHFLQNSSIDIQAIKQRDGSLQLLMTDKAIIEDLKTIHSKDDRNISLYEHVRLGTASIEEIERIITEKTRWITDSDLAETIKESIWNKYDNAKQYTDEYATHVGISEIGEGRFSLSSERKNLSNVESIGLARKQQDGLFKNLFMKKEKLIDDTKGRLRV